MVLVSRIDERHQTYDSLIACGEEAYTVESRLAALWTLLLDRGRGSFWVNDLIIKGR